MASGLKVWEWSIQQNTSRASNFWMLSGYVHVRVSGHGNISMLPSGG